MNGLAFISNSAMQRVTISIFMATGIAFSTPAMAREHGHATHHNINYAQAVQRDSQGKIARSPQAKRDLKKQHPCPSTGKSSGACPGYVIDHVEPLKRRGADAPSNMQWQTKEEAKQKDRTE